MKKIKKELLILGLLFFGLSLNMPINVHASIKKINIINSYDKTSGKFDLDGDAVKEKLKLNISMDDYTKRDIIKASLKINGKEALVLHSDDLGFATYINMDYIKMTNSRIFIRISAIGDSDGVYLDSFYRYNSSTGKLMKAGKLLNSEAVIKSVAASNIKIQYRQQFDEIGAVKWTSTYIVKNGKLKLKSNVSKVISSPIGKYDLDNYGKLFMQNKYKAMFPIKLYTDTSMKKIAYIVEADDILKLSKIKIGKRNSYVQFLKESKKGWLKLDYETYNPLFFGVENRLAG